MSEMVERVARAIHNAKPGNAWDWLREYAKGGDQTAKGIIDDRMLEARAAIEAMREPTEDMSVAALDCGPDRDAVTYWKVMIDAALKD